MSLIQDALKRKAQEQQQAGSPPPFADSLPPSVPSMSSIPAPTHPAPEEPVLFTKSAPPPVPIKKKPNETKPPFWRILLVFILIAGLIALLAAVTFYLIQRSSLGMEEPPPVQTAPPTEPQSRPGRLIEQSKEAVAAHDAVRQELKIQKEPIEPPPAEPAAETTPAVAEPVPAPPEKTTAPADSGGLSASSLLEKVFKKDAPPASRPPVKWPHLKITGIGSGSGEGIAFINGKMIRVGGMIDDVRIVEIRETELVAEYKGDRRTLRVGDE